MQMWDALVAVAGHVPLPFTGRDYLELLPVRWLAVHDHGIRLEQRTYDAELLGPWLGQPSTISARGGRWEVHHNPHDLRQIWIRRHGHDHLVEIPWIHRDHVHQPFDDRTWHHLRTTFTHRSHSPDHREADLAHALDDLQRRATSGAATRTEQAVLTRAMPARIPHPAPSPRTGMGPAPHTTSSSPAPGGTAETAETATVGAQRTNAPRSWARPPAAGSHPSTPARTRDGTGTVPTGGPDSDGPDDDADSLFDPDDTEYGFDPDDPWPDDAESDAGADDNGDNGEDRWGEPRQGNRTDQEQDVEDVEDPDDDGWDDDTDPDRRSPAPPYTGLGLWDAHTEAELW
ncbi:hypothetical protein LN042_35585 [Kitasatospora sp. RB6PN24]|uniref:Mu transposase C-terminal domain-containing protein n=1 Tax=Kitasatospora humi TaxID=2893891 RepID=UPI001E55CCB8|nr:Mu transposase C-terminal domain-containing protein [Kitasatospora humi]MCC9312323.1 hypothetical protein [Kitasatospora humi]